MWLDRTLGEWTSVRTGLVSPSRTWLKACGITLFGSAGGVLMNAPQYGSRSLSPWRENGNRMNERRLAALDEAVHVLLERRVVADLTQRNIDRMSAVVCCGAARHSARFDPRFDAAVIAQPAHALVRNHAPEPIVRPLQRPDHNRSQRNRRRAQRLDRQRSPPHVGLGVRANCRARQTDIPDVRDDRPQLVARLPFDLELLDAVEDLPVRIEGDAVGGTRLGALATDLAEFVDPQVDRLVGDER